MYDDMWVGGKCMYKLEPVVADGGELIIYAPHIAQISEVHGALIERLGYHTRDYFLKQWDRFKDEPWGVLAHSTHVRGIGTYEDGVEQRPRPGDAGDADPRRRLPPHQPGLPRPGLDPRGRLRGPGGRRRSVRPRRRRDAVPPDGPARMGAGGRKELSFRCWN